MCRRDDIIIHMRDQQYIEGGEWRGTLYRDLLDKPSTFIVCSQYTTIYKVCDTVAIEGDLQSASYRTIVGTNEQDRDRSPFSV